jgi:serine/threonine protein kinase
MESIEFVGEILGSGSFGSVQKAMLRLKGQERAELVAVKTLSRKFHTFNEAVSLREVQCLMHLDHPNIIRLIMVHRDEENALHLVFEYVEGSLLKKMEKQKR